MTSSHQKFNERCDNYLKVTYLIKQEILILILILNVNFKSYDYKSILIKSCLNICVFVLVVDTMFRFMVSLTVKLTCNTGDGAALYTRTCRFCP